MSWNEARVGLLKKLWAEGLSASQIADRVGEVTRNVARPIGLACRAGSRRRPALLRASREECLQALAVLSTIQVKLYAAIVVCITHTTALQIK
jgi:hypothetical protein